MTKEQIETTLKDLTHELLSECNSALDEVSKNKKSDDLHTFLNNAFLTGKSEGLISAASKIIALRKAIKKDEANDA